MPQMTQHDILRRMEDGYYLIQPVTYEKKEPPFYLVKDEMELSNIRAKYGLERKTDDKELVPRNVAKRLIASGKLTLSKSSNWRRYKLVTPPRLPVPD